MNDVTTLHASKFQKGKTYDSLVLNLLRIPSMVVLNAVLINHWANNASQSAFSLRAKNLNPSYSKNFLRINCAPKRQYITTKIWYHYKIIRFTWWEHRRKINKIRLITFSWSKQHAFLPIIQTHYVIFVEELMDFDKINQNMLIWYFLQSINWI